jgi:hypothetical protein
VSSVVLKSGLSEGHEVGGGDGKRKSKILGMFFKEFIHSQVEMRWSTILLKPRLFHAPSAGKFRYNAIFPRFKI